VLVTGARAGAHRAQAVQQVEQAPAEHDEKRPKQSGALQARACSCVCCAPRCGSTVARASCGQGGCEPE
jgi:hypothetical protein